MKVQIRQGVFETNSSSTHSITMCTKGDFEKWQHGQMKFYGDFGYGRTIANNPPKGYSRSEGKTYEDFNNYSELETYVSSFTTPRGETVVAFGAYGHD